MGEGNFTGMERRKHKRIKKQFLADMRVCNEKQAGASGHWNKVIIYNLGAGGILFTYDKKLGNDVVLDFMITVPMSSAPVVCKGRVIRNHDPEVPPLCRIAVCFFEITPADRELINRAAEGFYSRKNLAA